MDDALSDEEDSSYGPAPPPPAEPPTASEEGSAMESESMGPKTDNNDPPQDVTQDESFEDHHQYMVQASEQEDDLSVEIPPTTVVQRMVNREMHRETHSSSSKAPGSRVMLLAGAACCVVILAVVLGSGFGTGAFSSSSSSDSDSEPRGFDQQRADDVKLYLNSLTKAPEAMNQPDTAEYQALDWVTAQDSLFLGTDSASEQFRVVQRYALATLLFASVEPWRNQGGWLDPIDECSWFGVTCEPRDISGQSVNAVTAVELPNNGLSGYISPDIALLETLGILDLSRSSFVQDIAELDWSAFPNLRELRLSVNDFVGDLGVLAPLGTNLQVLDVAGNGFGPEISEGFLTLTGLTELSLEANRFNTDIPDCGVMTGLKTLRLGFNNWIAATFPRFVYVLENLEELRLERCNIQGPLEGALGRMLGLRILRMDRNSFEGAIPGRFAELAALEEFTVSRNALTGAFPDLSAMASLRILDLGDNELTGEVPDVWGNLPSLVELDLNGNQFSGIMPASIPGLIELQILDLSDNFFSGEIPRNIGALFNLRELDLSGNFDGTQGTGFSGVIPPSLGNLGNLEVLEMQSNLLSGELPTTFGNLASVREVFVDNNNLSGEIPQDIANWSNTIVSADFSANDFTGAVPSGICGGSLIEQLVADCTLDCECCTSCVE